MAPKDATESPKKRISVQKTSLELLESEPPAVTPGSEPETEPGPEPGPEPEPMHETEPMDEAEPETMLELEPGEGYRHIAQENDTAENVARRARWQQRLDKEEGRRRAAKEAKRRKKELVQQQLEAGIQRWREQHYRGLHVPEAAPTARGGSDALLARANSLSQCFANSEDRFILNLADQQNGVLLPMKTNLMVKPLDVALWEELVRAIADSVVFTSGNLDVGRIAASIEKRIDTENAFQHLRQHRLILGPLIELVLSSQDRIRRQLKNPHPPPRSKRHRGTAAQSKATRD
eukprot:COSAG05_NODE_5465_length_1167_cov_1.947566_2_plen_290_part_01